MPSFKELKTKLREQHLDAYGLVEHRRWPSVNNDPYEGQGDSVLRTSMAAIAMAAEGDTAFAAKLIDAIDNHAWDGKGNPTRHPEVRDRHVNGHDLGPSPLSKDGFLPLILACHTLYSSNIATTAEKAVAKRTLVRFIDYLIEHNWRLQSKYTDDQIANDIETNNPKGPETYILLPTDIHALRMAATAMGIPTFTWQVHGTSFTSALAQLVCDYVAYVCGALLSKLLKQLRWRQLYEIEIDSEWVGEFKLISGEISIGLPDGACDSIGDQFADHIREGARAVNLMVFQPDELIEKALRTSGIFPSGMTETDWLNLVMESFQEVLSWLDGDIVNAAFQYILFFEYWRLKAAEDDPKGYYTIQISFWVFFLSVQQSPEIFFLVQEPLNRFCSELRKHYMGPYAWINQDDDLAESLLDTFESAHIDDDSGFNKIPHLWEISRSGRMRHLSDTRMVDSSRVDYLLLKQLVNGHRPSAPNLEFPRLNAVLNRWGQQLIKRLEDHVRDSYTKLGRWTRARIDAAGNGIRESWDKTHRYIRSTYENGRRVVREQYEHGVLTLKDTWEDIQGQIRRIQSKIENGVERYRRTWVNGQREFVHRFDDGVEAVRQGYVNGELVFRHIWKGSKHTLRTFENGIIVSVSRWSSGHIITTTQNTIESIRDSAGNVTGQLKKRVKKIFGSPEVGRETYINDQLALVDSWDATKHKQSEYSNGREIKRRIWSIESGQMLEELSYLPSGERIRSLYDEGLEIRRFHFDSNNRLVIRHSWENNRYTQTHIESDRKVTYTWTNRVLHRKDYTFSDGKVRISLVDGLEVERVTTDDLGNRARERWDDNRAYSIAIWDTSGGPFQGDPASLSPFFRARFGSEA